MRCKVIGYRTWGIACTFAVLAAAPPARAQTAADKAIADSLFNEGKALINKQNDAVSWAMACERFAASFAKFPQLGTQIALASCYEKVGKLASAWATFRSAASLASKTQDRRQAFAEQRIADLEGKLARLVIRVSSSTMPGLVVKRDGEVVASAELDSALPVDPGEHVIEVSAPGRIPWATRVAIAMKPGVVEVPVPVLDKVAVAVAPVVDHPEDPRMRRASLYLMAGGGVVGLSSLAVGAIARSRWNDAQKSCENNVCSPAGVSKAHSARTAGNIATGVGLFGAGALIGGAILYFVSPRGEASAPHAGETTALRVLPSVDPTGAGLAISGGF